MIEQQALAPIGKRIAGGLVDLAFTLLAAAIALFTWGFLEGTTGAYTTAETWKGRGFLVGILIDCALTCYFMTGDKQATLGQRMLGIKTIKENGTQIEIGTALARYVVSIFSSLLAKIGFITALFSKNNRTWHDMAAGTLVVMQHYQPQANTNIKIVDEALISRTATEPSQSFNEDEIWEKVLGEYDSPERKKGLYAKLFAQFDGDEPKVKAQYLKSRVAQEKEELTPKIQTHVENKIENRKKIEASSQEKNSLETPSRFSIVLKISILCLLFVLVPIVLHDLLRF
jgi:uncharacterized RDD family membrane protein YckC